MDGGWVLPRRSLVPRPPSLVPRVPRTVPVPSPTPSSAPSVAPGWQAPPATARAAAPRSSATRGIATRVVHGSRRDSIRRREKAVEGGRDVRRTDLYRPLESLPSSCISRSLSLSLSHHQSRSIGVTRLTLRIGVAVAGLAVVGTTGQAQRRGGGRRGARGGPPPPWPAAGAGSQLSPPLCRAPPTPPARGRPWRWSPC